MVEIKLQVSERDFESFRQSALEAQIPVEVWLADALQKTLPVYVAYQEDMTHLSDEELIVIVRSMMPDEEADRLSELSHQANPTWQEQEERDYLRRKYTIGQYKKALAMAEAHKRGFLKDIL